MADQPLDFCLQRGFTLEEALNMVYEDDLDVREIFLEPPDTNVLTDEDSAEEDEGGMIDNLNRQQLSAHVEIKLHNAETEAESEIENGPEVTQADETQIQEVIEVEEPAVVTHNLPERPGKTKITWADGDLFPTPREFPKSDRLRYVNLTPVEVFEKFIDDEVVQYIVNESNKYALFLNHANPKITIAEMKCCLAILILTGYSELPGRDFYWDSQDDMRNQMVSNAMRRDKFRQILRYLHCADNTKPNQSDKLWKLRSIMDMLKQRFIENWIPEQDLDFDESMIKYFGRHSCKQFIRGKPIRFGYKMWCLNAPSGYLVNFDLYQGKNPKGNHSFEEEFGKNIAPMINMIHEFPEAVRKLPFRFYFDNLFTNFNVLFYLKQLGYDGTGTIRENRIPKSCPLLNKKDVLKQKKRGEFTSSLNKDDGIIVVKWVDNNVVAAASTCYGINPITKVKRFSRAEKKIIYVGRPSLLTEYNRFMGGTDLLDENVARYRISIRRKKWWWAIFTWLLDVSVVNAWTIYRKHEAISQLNFRRQIVQSYLTKYGVPPKGAGKPAISRSSVTLNRISDDLRYDGSNHLLVPNEGKKRRRCAGEGCSSSIRTKCRKCEVGLCIDCNEIFHTK